MTISRLRELLQEFEEAGYGDRVVIVSRGDAVETWDKVDDIIYGNWKQTSKNGGRFEYDPQAEDLEGNNAIWLAESL